MTTGSRPPTAVFLPGWLGDAKEWANLGADLPFWKAEFWTLEGHSALSWQAAIDNVVSRLPPNVLLVGYSMGARVALACALARPATTAGLVLVSAQPGIGDNERAARWQNDRSIGERLRTEPLHVFLEDWYQQPIFSTVDASTRLRWIADRSSLNPSKQRELLECFTVAKQPNFWRELPSLSVPTLLVAGAEDVKFASIARRMKAAIPRSQLQIIEHASHAPHRERPEAVLHCLRTWYQLQIESASPPP